MQLSVELNFGERTVYFLIGDRSDTSRKKESEAFPQSGSGMDVMENNCTRVEILDTTVSPLGRVNPPDG